MTTYWCALAGLQVYDPAVAPSAAEAAVEYVRRTLREGWESRPHARRLDGTFTVSVSGSNDDRTWLDVRVEWSVALAAGSDVPYAVFAQAVP